ncbi:MAG: hypothetical protein LUE27_02955 [Clostridia bacterium]|nr:hypothetical protein [Clostridia bacterium]
MTSTAEKKVEELMQMLHADSYKRSLDWNGCEVYEPQYKVHRRIGGPWKVFAYGDDARMSTREESITYLDYELKKRN